ncbi:pyridoxal-phosphate dependent enzyme [Vibrio gazogenes]|uniref:cysteine synthase n=1 Tax=Vibrio gazogenes DSM 21264 = NBRC 103151 TaxID=1123492 RepID=A0A1M4YUT5_VIBGA|nr:pyridoxal-phosphate dependent enzyme [Vibrio gazogenes]USP15106.1 pyridoxal-phosphate dependent enzyme [Vibrio gazogenes]SHF09531.1 cysteine synthase A [Vibrio gazogenes DSM 21264] [Vibrio gazogenes DSM 21264 = NBRC 103151]SJN56399.1 Cysteine synthase [Vibrio gazogenes]
MFDHISEAIKTPQIIKVEENLYVARFESMKIYSTLSAVGNLLDAGKINKYSILIDSSSGIYAYALALACHKYGLKCHIIASKTVDSSIRVQLELLGAKVDGVPSAGSLKLDQKYRVEKVKDILEKNPNYYWMQQYHDDIHYHGYREFATVIKKQLNVDTLTVVGGVGSGCSTGGLVTGLNDLGVNVRLCGVQPFGSVTFGAEHVDDPEIIIAGIGSAIEFLNVKHNLYDSINWISFDYSLSGTIDIMKKHAIFAGLSTGAAWCVGKLEQRKNPNTPCLVIAPDTGHRYVESVFSRHIEALPLDQLEPKHINNAQELSLPWSQYNWDRNEKSNLENFKKLNTEVLS